MYQGLSGAIQGKEWPSPLHLGVVAIEKGSLHVTLDYGRQLYLQLFWKDKWIEW